MVLQQVKNNARGTLKVSIGSGTTSIILNTGEGELFPSSNFRITAKDYVAGVLVSQEIINISTRTGDVLTVISRASEPCPRDSVSLTQESTAFAFSAYTNQENGTIIEHNITANIISSIDTALSDRLTISDYIAGTKLYDDTITGTDAYAITIDGVTSYSQIDGQSFRVKVDVSNTDIATLNINALGAKNIRKYGGDPLLTGDIVGGQIIEVIWNNYANQFELSSIIDASNEISSEAQVKNFTLGYIGTSTNIVAIGVDGKIYKANVDGNTTLMGYGNLFLQTRKTLALSSTSFVSLFVSNGGQIHTGVGQITGNNITYGILNSYSIGGFSSFQGTQSLIVLSPTKFVVVVSYNTGGGSGNFLDATVYTVSGTTITRGTTLSIVSASATAQTILGGCYVANDKFMISYTAGTSTIVSCTVSGTTITAGTPSSSLGIVGIPQYISNDKIAITDGANIRLYTFSGTTPIQGNNLIIGTTYTSYAMRNIDNSKCIFTGTVSTNTQAFIVDCSGTTPSKGTIETVLNASTSTDCCKAGDTSILVVTGGNKYYYYSYSGTTLQAINNETKTNSIGLDGVDFLSYMSFITFTTSTTVAGGFSQFVSNLKKFIIGGLKQSGVVNDIRPVVMSGILSGFTGLMPSLPYNLGTIYIGKAVSSTEVYIAIPHSTL